jgi:hypothetical protein
MAIPGKTALAALNSHFQSDRGISVTPAQIIKNFPIGGIPPDLRVILNSLNDFSGNKAAFRNRSSAA